MPNSFIFGSYRNFCDKNDNILMTYYIFKNRSNNRIIIFLKSPGDFSPELINYWSKNNSVFAISVISVIPNNKNELSSFFLVDVLLKLHHRFINDLIFLTIFLEIFLQKSHKVILHCLMSCICS